MAPPGAWLAYYPVVHQAPQTGRIEDRRPQAGTPRSSKQSKHTYAFSFTSSKAPGMTAISDPYSANHYYGSVIGTLGTTASAWR
jgi:hypothetical protein